MSADTDIVDRDQQMLAELAELDLALARHVQARALATDDAAEVAELGRTYQRVSCSLRQSLALKAKLKRDAEQHAGWLQARSFRPRAFTASPAPADRAVKRRDELEAAVGRVIWAEREFEGPDWEVRQERRLRLMEHYLHVDSRKDRFGGGTLDEDIITLCGDLGLSRLNALNWRKLPEPEFDDEDGDDADGADPEDIAEPHRSSG